MVLDDEYGDFEMNNEFVSSVDFVAALIDLDIFDIAESSFANNCQSFQDYQSEIENLSMQGMLPFPETNYRIYDNICKCIGRYTSIPTEEFASVLAPLRNWEYDSDEAYEALLQPVEAWTERMSRLPAAEVA